MDDADTGLAALRTAFPTFTWTYEQITRAGAEVPAWVGQDAARGRRVEVTAAVREGYLAVSTGGPEGTRGTSHSNPVAAAQYVVGGCA